jgi:hypothetical protein
VKTEEDMIVNSPPQQNFMPTLGIYSIALTSNVTRVDKLLCTAQAIHQQLRKRLLVHSGLGRLLFP